MDDLPAQGHTEEEPDREAAATLAEMATALAEASAPPVAESEPPEQDDASRIAHERPAGRLKRFVLSLPTGRLASPIRWLEARPTNLRPRVNARSWGRTQRIAKRAIAFGLAVALVLTSAGSAAPLNVVAPRPSRNATTPGARPSATASLAAPSSHGSLATNPVAMASGAGPTGTTSGGPHVSSPSPAATITFRQLVLDGSTDPDGSSRSFSFVSDGPGAVSAEIVQTSPLDSTKLCVAVDDAPPACTTGATPGFTTYATTAHSSWTVTLASPNKSSPTVDVEFTWHTDHPSIALDHCRFQGSPNPDSMRTLTADFTAHAAGSLRVSAAWSRTSVDATLTLADLSGTEPVAVSTAEYPGEVSISPPFAHPLAIGRTYEMTLYNNGRDSGRTLLMATIAFS